MAMVYSWRMNTFSPLFSNIVESSIWEEAYHVRILFVSMLAIKDLDHVVRKNEYQLRKRANITEAELAEGLKVLLEPDLKRPGQPFGGRRIERVNDGFLILNGQFYEEQMRTISRRFYKARKQREYRRAAGGAGGSGPSLRENLAAKAEGDGDTASADRLATSTNSTNEQTKTP